MTESARVFNRQRKKRLELAEYRKFAEAAVAEVRKRNRSGGFPQKIEILFISDPRIRQLHRDFLKVDAVTDVITFDHGEIFISVESAARHAQRFATSFRAEICLYIVHALLHLAGYDDRTEQGRNEMAALQEEIVRKVEATLLISATSST